MPRALTALISLLFACALVLAAQVRLDDSFGDPTNVARISYPYGWNIGSSCKVCQSKPNASDAYMNTWHDNTQWNTSSQATVNFVGSGVAVYGILDLAIFEPTDLTFYLDGATTDVSYYNTNNNPNISPQYQYDVQFFSVDSLALGPHVLTIKNGQDLIGASSALLLDYITYETERVFLSCFNSIAEQSKVLHRPPRPNLTKPPLSLE
ncbi:hypothetical protein C8J56DRAFT_214976 [Mycena floridula]|nr:hypothetical protein C8J56DRAFT_214976 [Mycena floridula]